MLFGDVIESELLPDTLKNTVALGEFLMPSWGIMNRIDRISRLIGILGFLRDLFFGFVGASFIVLDAGS